MKLLITMVLAGMAISANSQAASVYAVSVNKISNFSMDFSSGSGSFNSFTFSNDAAANGAVGASAVDMLDAAASCINCSYDNEFVAHTLLTDFSYGDALITSAQITSPNVGAASAIAEAQVSSGTGFAMGANKLMTVGFQISDDASIGDTAINFSFASSAYMEASAGGAGAALSTMSMSMILMDLAGNTVWQLAPSALNKTLTSGSYSVNQNIAGGSQGLTAGNYNLVIDMSQSVNVSAVPVPAALPLMLSGLLGLFGLARRNRVPH